MWFCVEIRNLNRYLIKYRLIVYRLFYSYPVKRCEYILWLKIRKKCYRNNNSNAEKSSFTLVYRINRNDSSVNVEWRINCPMFVHLSLIFNHRIYRHRLAEWKWNTLYTPDCLSHLTKNQTFLSKSIESPKYSMFLKACHSKVHADQATVTKNQTRCNRRKRAIRGIRNAIRSRKYVTERVRRCENKKRERRGKDKCIKGCDLENGGGLRRPNLFLVHSSQTNRERKRGRERERVPRANTQTMFR